MQTLVVNMATDKNCVPVDRSTCWGNPYPITHNRDRKLALKHHARWFAGQPELIARLPELAGHKIGCHCAPAPCHADLLATMCDLPYLYDKSPQQAAQRLAELPLKEQRHTAILALPIGRASKTRQLAHKLRLYKYAAALKSQGAATGKVINLPFYRLVLPARYLSQFINTKVKAIETTRLYTYQGPIAICSCQTIGTDQLYRQGDFIPPSTIHATAELIITEEKHGSYNITHLEYITWLLPILHPGTILYQPSDPIPAIVTKET